MGPAEEPPRHLRVSTNLAENITGVRVVSVLYRLAPEHPFPDMPQEEMLQPTGD